MKTLLDRVIVHKNPQQDEAATFHRDGDVIHLTINSSIVNAEALVQYRVRAAVRLGLRGMTWYRKAVVKLYGTLATQDEEYEKGFETTTAEFEQLVFALLNTSTINPSEVEAQQAPVSPAEPSSRSKPKG
jgi:hypothetical protein